MEFANWKSYNKAKTVPTQKLKSSYSLAQFSLTAISLEDAALTKMLPRKIFGMYCAAMVVWFLGGETTKRLCIYYPIQIREL